MSSKIAPRDAIASSKIFECCYIRSRDGLLLAIALGQGRSNRPVLISEKEYERNLLCHAEDQAKLNARRQLGQLSLHNVPVRYHAVWRWDNHYPVTVESELTLTPRSTFDPKDLQVTRLGANAVTNLLALPCTLYDPSSARTLPPSNILACYHPSIQSDVEAADKLDRDNDSVSKPTAPLRSPGGSDTQESPVLTPESSISEVSSTTSTSPTAIPSDNSNSTEAKYSDIPELEAVVEVDRVLFYLFERTSERFIVAYRDRVSDRHREPRWALGPENSRSAQADAPYVKLCVTKAELSELQADNAEINLDVQTDFRWYMQRARDPTERFAEMVGKAHNRLMAQYKGQPPSLLRRPSNEKVTANAESTELPPAIQQSLAADNLPSLTNTDTPSMQETKTPEKLSWTAFASKMLERIPSSDATAPDATRKLLDLLTNEEEKEVIAEEIEKPLTPPKKSGSFCMLQHASPSIPTPISAQSLPSPKSTVTVTSAPAIKIRERPRPISSSPYLVDAMYATIKYLANVPNVYVISNCFAPLARMYPTPSMQTLPMSFTMLMAGATSIEAQERLLNQATSYALIQGSGGLKALQREHLIELYRTAGATLIDAAIARNVTTNWNPAKYAIHFNPVSRIVGGDASNTATIDVLDVLGSLSDSESQDRLEDSKEAHRLQAASTAPVTPVASEPEECKMQSEDAEAAEILASLERFRTIMKDGEVEQLALTLATSERIKRMETQLDMPMLQDSIIAAAKRDLPLAWSIQPYLGPLYDNPMSRGAASDAAKAQPWPLVQLISSQGSILAANITPGSTLTLTSKQMNSLQVPSSCSTSLNVSFVSPSMTVEAKVDEIVRRRREIRQLNRLSRMEHGTPVSFKNVRRSLSEIEKEATDSMLALFGDDEDDLGTFRALSKVDTDVESKSALLEGEFADGEGKCAHPSLVRQDSSQFAIPYLNDLVDVLNDYTALVREKQFHSLQKASQSTRKDGGIEWSAPVSNELLQEFASRLQSWRQGGGHVMSGRSTLRWEDGVLDPELDAYDDLRVLYKAGTQMGREQLALRRKARRESAIARARSMSSQEAGAALELVLKAYDLAVGSEIATVIVKEARNRRTARKAAAAALEILSDSERAAKLSTKERARLHKRVTDAGLMFTPEAETIDVDEEERVERREITNNTYLRSIRSIDDGDDEALVAQSLAEIQMGIDEATEIEVGIEEDLKSIDLDSLASPHMASVWRVIPASLFAPIGEQSQLIRAAKQAASRANLSASALGAMDPMSAYTTCLPTSGSYRTQEDIEAGAVFGDGLAAESNLHSEFVLQLAIYPDAPEIHREETGKGGFQWTISGPGILYVATQEPAVTSHTARMDTLEQFATSVGETILPTGQLSSDPALTAKANRLRDTAFLRSISAGTSLQCTVGVTALCQLGSWRPRTLLPGFCSYPSIPLWMPMRWSFVTYNPQTQSPSQAQTSTPSSGVDMQNASEVASSTFSLLHPFSPARSNRTSSTSGYSWVIWKDSAFEDPIANALAQDAVRPYALSHMLGSLDDANEVTADEVRKSVHRFNHLRHRALYEALCDYKRFEMTNVSNYLLSRKHMILMRHAIERSTLSLSEFAKNYHYVAAREVTRLVRDAKLRPFLMHHSVPSGTGPRTSMWAESGYSFYFQGGAHSGPLHSFVQYRRLTTALLTNLSAQFFPAQSQIAKLRAEAQSARKMRDTLTDQLVDLHAALIRLHRGQIERSGHAFPDCIICFAEPACQLLVPCGHFVCPTCATQLRKCPFCRAPITESYRGFLSHY